MTIAKDACIHVVVAIEQVVQNASITMHAKLWAATKGTVLVVMISTATNTMYAIVPDVNRGTVWSASLREMNYLSVKNANHFSDKLRFQSSKGSVKRS